MIVRLTLALLLLSAGAAWAQPDLLTRGKGSKPPAHPTTTAVDADTNALDVKVANTAVGQAMAIRCVSTDGLSFEACGGGGGGGGTSMTDDAAFTPGTTAFTPAGGTYRSTLDSVNDGDGGAFAMTIWRGLMIHPRDLDGDSMTNESLNALRVHVQDTVSVVSGANPGADGLLNSLVYLDSAAGKPLAIANFVYNGATWDRARAVVAGQDTTGTGIAAAGILGQLDDTATAAVTENQFAPLRIDANRRLLVRTPNPATPGQTSPAADTASFTVLAANTARLGATLYLDSTTDCKVKLGGTASSTSFSVLIYAATYYEVPFGYTGVIDGICTAATGNFRVTELAQ